MIAVKQSSMPDSTCTAILIDTVSIQQYIFSSNKLKENIGASYIIEHLLYEDAMTQCLRPISTMGIFEEWDDKTKTAAFLKGIAILTDKYDVEIAYIGGGNAMVFIKEENPVPDIYSDEFKKTKAYEFIKTYSQYILLYFPGLKVSFGVNTAFDLNDKDFKKQKRKTVECLVQNKSFFQPVNIPFKNGIVDDCPNSNESAEKITEPGDDKRYISKSSRIKIEKSEDSQNSLMNNKELKSILTNKYIFTNQIDQLSQPDEKGYVAIVHVDGNGIGSEFIKCKSLEALRDLSKQVNDISKRVMCKLIDHIARLFDDKHLTESNGFKLHKVDENDPGSKKYLPIRPLITAGDDFTFVCEGRLGVHLAEMLIKLLNEERIEIEIEGNKKPLSACGGVTIVKTHYPFYRAYTLAEELTKQSKAKAREFDDAHPNKSKDKEQTGSQWVSYLISAGGFAGDLEAIETQQFTTVRGNKLRLESYCVEVSTEHLKDVKDEDIHTLKDNILAMTTGDTRWPTNKLHELRNVLRDDDAQQKLFFTETTARDLTLPLYNNIEATIEHKNEEIPNSLWFKKDEKENKYTPYFDIIELKDFYPEPLLKIKPLSTGEQCDK